MVHHKKNSRPNVDKTKSHFLPDFQKRFDQLLSSTVSPTSSGVIGFIGHNVTLPCRYDAQSHGVLSFCWGRGEVPRSKCSDTILSSEDGRYLLMGNLGRGDVSLTIRHVQESDSGIYGCRVEIPGWFNDQKHHLKLTVEAGGCQGG
uniref:Ig-like domain-containing protein n=1 Tax=Seriola lalandi dorsalis TaxID=1841481 RepID=A0A3B4XQT0_SERLL